MKTIQKIEALSQLTEQIRTMVQKGAYEAGKDLVRHALAEYPHAAEPQNLFGVLLELEGDHILAMKHFRAAWALDPTYLPARVNLERYGSFARKARPVFNEADCPAEPQKERYKIEYDDNGVGYVVRRNGEFGLVR